MACVQQRLLSIQALLTKHLRDAVRTGLRTLDLRERAMQRGARGRRITPFGQALGEQGLGEGILPILAFRESITQAGPRLELQWDQSTAIRK